MEVKIFNEEQIALALRQVETGTSVEEVCTDLGVSQATFCSWKKQYSGLSVPDLRRLLHMETKVERLRKLVGRLMVFTRLGILAVSIYGGFVILRS